jgi:hypothetical protein
VTIKAGTYLLFQRLGEFWGDTLAAFLQFLDVVTVLLYFPVQLRVRLQILGEPSCAWSAADKSAKCNKFWLYHFIPISARACTAFATTK